jgi:hypothetical protein
VTSPEPTPSPDRTQSALDQPAAEHRTPGELSEHDPPADGGDANRAPLLLVIVVVLLVTAVVVLHLTGVLGPGSH